MQENGAEGGEPRAMKFIMFEVLRVLCYGIPM